MKNLESVQDNRNKRTSGLLTICVIGGLAGLMFIFGFTPPYPPLEGEGLLVDFGTDLTGLGLTEPAPAAASAPAPSAAVKETKAITQNIEESIKINEHKDVVKPKNQTQPNKNTNNNTTTTNTTTQTQIDKDQLFNQSKLDSKGTGSSSEGNTKPGGDQGVPNGDLNGYHGAGEGIGDDGSIGWSLDGRSMKSKPVLRVDHNETGDVRIKIYVNRDGKVFKAEYERTGSTITDTYLINQSKSAALKSTFNGDDKAPETQIGYITFHFKLQ